MVFGAKASFSDTEKNTGNVLAAGIIDISVDEENPWETTLLPPDDTDLKPGQNREVSFNVRNEGANDLVLWKKVKVTGRFDGGEPTEPEKEAENGSPVEDVDSQIHYEMNVGGTNTILYDWGIMMSDVDDLWIPLGRVNAGQTLAVTQIYTLDENAGNQYQGDYITFDIELYAEQLLGPGPSHTEKGLVLENKLEPDWTPIMDQTWGLLTWDGSGNYRLRAWGLPGSQYRLQGWNTDTDSDLGYFGGPFSGGNLDETGTYSGLNSNSNAKYWLRETASWNNLETLWESNLVH